jgi:hypothetical protein
VRNTPVVSQSRADNIFSVFYLLIALNAVSTLVFYLCYRPPSFGMKHGSARQIEFIKHFDYIGLLLMTLGVMLFLMGLSWGGVLHPWNSAHVIATIVVGFLTLVGFVLWEVYGDLKEPLLPMHLFLNRGWVVSVVLWSIGAAIYYANAILWPSMVAVLYASSRPDDPMWAGWLSCVPNAAIIAGEIVGAFFKKKTNYQIMVVFTIGAAFLAGKFICFGVPTAS